MIPDSAPGGHSIITADCRELEPPEPMVVVLEAVDKLQKTEVLKMLHRQAPRLLFPLLKERGMVTHLDTFEDGSIELWIWKEGQ
ncbi:MAG: DUF2249 domain-containing protein [SAR324 cluster bacterium]|nr:DUF2249 domain-containing protein [SAR324 cluster bacterium]